MSAISEAYNPHHDILNLFDILTLFCFVTSETGRFYYY